MNGTARSPRTSARSESVAVADSEGGETTDEVHDRQTLRAHSNQSVGDQRLVHRPVRGAARRRQAAARAAGFHLGLCPMVTSQNSSTTLSKIPNTFSSCFSKATIG